MKQLLIEEMKRAIEIMESKEEIKVMQVEHIPSNGYRDGFDYATVDRETSELKQMFRMIRKHSVMLEKEIK